MKLWIPLGLAGLCLIIFIGKSRKVTLDNPPSQSQVVPTVPPLNSQPIVKKGTSTPSSVTTYNTKKNENNGQTAAQEMHQKIRLEAAKAQKDYEALMVKSAHILKENKNFNPVVAEVKATANYNKWSEKLGSSEIAQDASMVISGMEMKMSDSQISELKERVLKNLKKDPSQTNELLRSLKAQHDKGGLTGEAELVYKKLQTLQASPK